jgi:molybdenum cofactor synthesis domain-containing protein
MATFHLDQVHYGPTIAFIGVVDVMARSDQAGDYVALRSRVVGAPLHLSQVIMTTANALTPKEIAALLVIGDKILSGRTKDKNIGYIAEYLTALGINLKEVRVVGDEETAIVDALNALRHRYTYVFTTGGIGPAHDDITSDCVAKAFGVPIEVDPRALAILHEWLKATGAEMSEARMRMTRIPMGADLVLNQVSGAPGFWIGNVIVLAGVPSIMQAMLDQVGPKLKTGIRLLSETLRADARESDIGTQLGEIAKANPGVAIGSHPFFDPQHGPNTNVVLRASDAQKLQRAKRMVEDMLQRVQGAQSGSA